MHTLWWITFDKVHADSRAEAIAYAKKQLIKIVFPGFYEFDDCIGDWFEIGGRWSGEIQVKLMGSSYRNEMDKIYNGRYYLMELDVKENALKLQSLWDEFKGEGKHPLLRDENYRKRCLDDAILIDERIYDAILTSEPDQWYDFDKDTLSKENMIGKKWLIVADIHS